MGQKAHAKEDAPALPLRAKADILELDRSLSLCGEKPGGC